MAVKLEFYNLIVPLENIRRVAENLDRIPYPMVQRKVRDALDRGAGVWDPCWYDGHLFREGAMGGEGIEESIEGWCRCGLEPHEERDGKRHWKDLCVAASGEGVINYPCEWAVFDSANNAISLNSAPDALLVGPDVSRGVEAYEAKDYAKALAWLTPLANDSKRYGSAEAQRQLATMYFRGEGVQRDFGQAAAVLIRAAEAYDRDARRALARLYETGSLYEDGKGIPRDPGQAYRWYYSLWQMPQDRHLVEGIDLDALVAPVLARASLAFQAGDYTAARALYEPLGYARNMEALKQLALIDGQGLGCPRNVHLAATWLMDATSDGDLESCLTLETLYETGNLYGAPSDFRVQPDRADRWRRRAAKIKGPGSN